MPITPTYPGVYVEEIPSGVRTITGVSTSVTAFIGHARRGPINQAVRILGFADFERRFGGLARESELSYAVRQFFTNGGSEAWVVRVARTATAASFTLLNGTTQVLVVSAKDAGSAGENIRLIVDYETANPGSTFSLTAIYSSNSEPGGGVVEKFENLSMNSKDPRYVKTIVNGGSQLITVERHANALSLVTAATKGLSRSGDLSAATAPFGLDASHNQFRISVNGSDFATVTIPLTPAITSGALLATNVTTALNAVSGLPARTVAFAANRLTIQSALGNDETSSVRILPGLSNDASVALKLGPVNGGEEIDASAVMRPTPAPVSGNVTGTSIAKNTAPTLPAKLQISVDGSAPALIDIPAGPTNLTDIAAALEGKVRSLNLASDAFRKFTVTLQDDTAVPANTHVVLRSGTRGSGSSVAVFPGSPDLAVNLGLTGAVTTTAGADVRLQGGTETAFDPADTVNSPFPVIIASRTNRTGLYALDNVDLFNLLCMPGVTDGPTLAEAAAYCQERRAFLIADSPPNKKKPDEMEAHVKSPAVPKTNYGAVYYPWIRIADENGILRTSAPCGTVAGVYARTDATRGVWKAPAGTDATLVGVQGVEYALTDRENGILNPRGVNCNRIFPTAGPVAWGARTLQGDNDLASEWKYVPVRRVALFIEESLYRGTQWVVFEPNDEPLWSQIRLNVGAFMQNLFRQGAFQGRTPREAYLVKCDKETTTQNDVNLGIVNILVGFAPLKPAEFVFLKIQQLAGQIQV